MAYFVIGNISQRRAHYQRPGQTMKAKKKQNAMKKSAKKSWKEQDFFPNFLNPPRIVFTRVHCQGSSYLYASTHMRTWKRMWVYHKRECRFLQRDGHAIGQQNVRWKLEDWIRASICTATLLFSQPFFSFTEKWEGVNFKHCVKMWKSSPRDSKQ